MAFHIHTGNRVETLAEKLAGVISDNPLPVFHDDIVVVQSKGMERWLRMEIAKQNGICATISFPFPRTFFYGILTTVIDAPDESLFSPQVMQWKLMNILPGMRHLPAFQSVNNYIRGENEELKLFQLSARIAALFDQYLVYRPEMITAWEQGSDSITGSPHETWQAELWRALTGNTAEPGHPAALKTAFLKQISTAAAVEGLPPRVCVFGISTLPPFYMQMLKAVSTTMDVHFFYHNPCKEFWQYIQSEKDLARQLCFADDEQGLYLETGNSLLASMGRVGKDFFELIMNLFDGDTGMAYFSEPGYHTMLSCIQSDILNLANRSHENLPEEDRSIEIQCCYSPMREVEALYDNLLSLFDENPRLRPQDIIVMVPDISAYAPLIKAVFDNPEQERLSIPYAVADRSLNMANPVAETLMKMLLLDQNRFRVTEVLDILAQEAVHRKFGFEEGDMPTVRNWIARAGICWAIDEQYKRELDMPAFHENTWRFGLDRLVMGYAMSTDEPAGLYPGILPCGEFESEGSALLGSLNTFLENLFAAVKDLRTDRPLQHWAETLMKLMDDFFTEDAPTGNDIQTIRDLVIEIMETASLSGFNKPVGIAVIRGVINSLLDQKTAACGFISRGVTFCTLLPMRSIPFQVVYLMGMNDEGYPRKTKRQGFDLIEKNKQLCDPDKRSEDKFLFLEALLSARKNFFISYVGRNVKDNSEIMPSALVQELCDYIRRAFGPEKGDAIVKRHPLQPFSPRYFMGKTLFSYSPQNLETAKAITTPRTPGPFISAPIKLPDEERRFVNFQNLVRFFKNPCEFFLKHRLCIHLHVEDTALPDNEPFELDSLQSYIIQNDLIKKMLSGKETTTAYETIRADGALPPGGTGRQAFYTVLNNAEMFFLRVDTYTKAGLQQPFEAEIDIGSLNVKLFIRFEHIYKTGQVFFRPATLKAKDLLEGWLFHLGLCLCRQHERHQTTVLATDEETTFHHVPKDAAEKEMTQLLELYFQGNSKPLCFFPETSLEFAKTFYREKHKIDDEVMATTKALNSARGKWSGHRIKESEDEYVGRCFGKECLETDAFIHTARTVFSPILSASGKK